MAGPAFPASKPVRRSHPGNPCRDCMARPAGARRAATPAIECARGMESPANGIFFSRAALLMAGGRRRETRRRRPRALAPPVLPNGDVRRGGSNVEEPHVTIRERYCGARRRDPATDHPEPGPAAAPRAAPPPAGRRPGGVFSRSGRRALRPAGRDGPEAPEKSRGINGLYLETGGAGQEIRGRPYSR